MRLKYFEICRCITVVTVLNSRCCLFHVSAPSADMGMLTSLLVWHVRQTRPLRTMSNSSSGMVRRTFPDKHCLIVGWQTPKKRLIKEVRTHHKKDGFFLHNFFIWCLKVRKSNVVLTDHCQIYGLPLTSHVILARIRTSQFWLVITWDVNGSP